MKTVFAVFSGVWQAGWLIGHRFGWDTLATAVIVLGGSALAVFMVG